MSILTREFVSRHPLVASGSSLECMYEYKQFYWVKYPADIEHIVSCFRHHCCRDHVYYHMLETFVAASTRCGLPVDAIAQGLDDRIEQGVTQSASPVCRGAVLA